MPRLNFYVLLGLSLVSLICYRQADVQRSRYGQMFHTFVNVMEQIEANYVEPVDERELFEGALTGMTRQLDEYSAYINPRDFTELQEDLGKAFGGIGIQVSLDDQTKQLTVMSPLVGTPAYEAGILAGDKIVEINGESTEGFSLQDAVGRIRGESGEEIGLTIVREGQPDPMEFLLERAEIHVDTVLGDTRHPDDRWNYFLAEEERIGYVRITAFSEQTTEELEEALVRLAEQNMQALILDLRNNPGGLLRSAVEICDLFIADGTIVTTRGRGGEVLEEFEAMGPGTYQGFPMVVLVNKYSASASEIVAACLQDHDRAVVIGERTWGKGSVQNIISLEGGTSALKLTMASYWRPSGENIHRGRNAKEEDQWGVLPNEDFEVPLEPEEFQQMMKERRQRDVVRGNGSAKSAEPEVEPVEHDPQLEKAVEYLEEQLQHLSSKAPA